MILLTSVEVQGESDAGPFAGMLPLSGGLQVISARNSFGKSLAITAVPWCLGVEPIFGIRNNDSTCFPPATREEVDLPNHPKTRVLSSQCSITLRREDGDELRLTRAIKGDSSLVQVEERPAGKEARTSKLQARTQTMQDEHGGLQRFLFEWLDWPRATVSTFHGKESELYIENLVPCFYIDQDEGWPDLQTLQISRYGQQQIGEVAIEYLLGATDSIKARVARLHLEQKTKSLHKTARELAGRVAEAFLRRGWRVEWSGHGQISDVLARWSSKKIRDVLHEEANVDLPRRHRDLTERLSMLRRALRSDPVDPQIASAHVRSSQRVIELKQERHRLNVELNGLRRQQEQASDLVRSLEHRIQAAQDLLRLKTIGVGRLEHMECPTCHRDVDAVTFNLTEQSAASVSAHIESLKRDRAVMQSNYEGITESIVVARGGLAEVDRNLNAADRDLLTVTEAVGTVREQVAQIAADLAAVEREIDQIDATLAEIDMLQGAVDEWIVEASAVKELEVDAGDLETRKTVFVEALRSYLIALGHSAFRQNVDHLELDDQYVPHLDQHRLRSLGSASDKPRLVAAYTLALAAASCEIRGLHPGFVILDEPLQQNPDDVHRELFLDFLAKELARGGLFQTIVLTYLQEDEVAQLKEKGTPVATLSGHFLKPVTESTYRNRGEARSGEERERASKVGEDREEEKD